MANMCFDRSNLSGANFNGSRLNIRAMKADFRGANFEGCILSCCDLFDCNMLNARFKNATLSVVRVAGSDFNHADFEGASLDDVDGLSKAWFAGANLSAEQIRAILCDAIKEITSYEAGDAEDKLERKLLRGKTRKDQRLGSAE